MENEYLVDISEDAVETSFEYENVQQPQSSLQIRGMESQKKQLLASEEMCGHVCQLRAAMKELEGEARRWYSSMSNHIHSDTFREMMLTDAAFIIHTFRCFDRWCKNPGDPKLQDNAILNTPWNAPNVCEDLLMLENQLPFFVLVKVYAILTNEEKSENSLKKLAMQFFTLVELGRADNEEDEDDSVSVANKPKHLLDFFHSSFAVAKPKKKDAKAAREKKDAKAAKEKKDAKAAAQEKQDYIKDDKSKKMQKRKKIYIHYRRYLSFE
nr:putative UPF0481 protein At3g02645 [Ipomoea trifida]